MMLEDAVMAQVDSILAHVHAAAELEVIGDHLKTSVY